MTPYPDSDHARRFMNEKEVQIMGFDVWMQACEAGVVDYHNHEGVVELAGMANRRGIRLPYHSIVTHPSFYRMQTLRYNDLSPVTTVGATHVNPSLLKYFGTFVNIEPGFSYVSDAEERLGVVVSRSDSDSFNHYEQKIAGALSLVPFESWETITKSGLVMVGPGAFQDGITPLIIHDAFVPLDEAPVRIGIDDYVNNRMWEHTGSPVVMMSTGFVG